MDVTFALGSSSELEVNEEGADRVEVTWSMKVPGSGSDPSLTLLLDRDMATELHRRLERVLSGRPVEAAVDA